MVPVVILGLPFDVWLYRGLVLAVVACPCALVISTPVSIVSALAGAARRGVLVKGGIHLERMARVRVVAFDKTGAVTTGRLSLEAIEPLGGHSPDELLSVAASLESQSEHPVATAILASARDRGVALRAPTGVRALPGLGVEGWWTVCRWCAGRRGCSSRGSLNGAATAVAQRLASSGMSPVVVVRNGEAIGMLGVKDRPKADAPAW